MDPSEYREFVRARIPRPTSREIDAYGEFVSDDHSWYQHLPLVGPGEPFILYLAPHAGQVYLDGGTTSLGWRDVIVDAHKAKRFGRSFTLDLSPGDETPIDLHMTLHGTCQTTAERRTAYGYWLYWNHGRPHESRDTHITRAEEHLHVYDDDGCAMPLPREVIEAGLVYLNGTVSGFLGGYTDDEYNALRAERNLPSHDEAREIQLDAISAAMHRVVNLLWN